MKSLLSFLYESTGPYREIASSLSKALKYSFTEEDIRIISEAEGWRFHSRSSTEAWVGSIKLPYSQDVGISSLSLALSQDRLKRIWEHLVEALPTDMEVPTGWKEVHDEMEQSWTGPKGTVILTTWKQSKVPFHSKLDTLPKETRRLLGWKQMVIVSAAPGVWQDYISFLKGTGLQL
jgi:hypothetical protein